MNISQNSNHVSGDRRLLHKMLFRAVFILLFLLINSVSAFASIYSPLSVRQLILESDLIVAGEIASVQYVAKNGGNAQVSVEHILKGKIQKKFINVSFSNTSILIPINVAGTPKKDTLYSNIMIAKEYGIFFLKKEKESYVSTDPIHTILPVRKGRQFSGADSPNPLTLVREELLYTALGPTVFSKGDEVKIQLYQRESQKIEAPKIINLYPVLPMNVKAVHCLAKPEFGASGNVIPSHAHEANALRTLLSTDNNLLRGAVLTTLLTFGQFDVLDEAVNFINTVQQMPTSAKRARLSIQVNDIAMAIRYVNGAKYIPALGNLLQNHHVGVRRSAINALANFVYQSTPFDKPITNLKDSIALPFLIEALDDSNSQVRYAALRALPRATNKPSWAPQFLPTGKLNLTPEEEQKLITQWKQWWVNEGSKAFNATQKEE